MGLIASLWRCADHFGSSPTSRHSRSLSACLKGANSRLLFDYRSNSWVLVVSSLLLARSSISIVAVLAYSYITISPWSVALFALPAVAGKFGLRGGGYTLSNSKAWDLNARDAAGELPTNSAREVNMNLLGRTVS